MTCVRCHQPINTGELFTRICIAGEVPGTEGYSDTPLAAHLTCPEQPKPDTELTPRERIAKNAWQRH